MICRYCNDRGCLCCAGERQRHFNRLYPDGKVEPVFVAQTDDPADMALLKEHFGAEHVNYQRLKPRWLVPRWSNLPCRDVWPIDCGPTPILWCSVVVDVSDI